MAATLMESNEVKWLLLAQYSNQVSWETKTSARWLLDGLNKMCNWTTSLCLSNTRSRIIKQNTVYEYGFTLSQATKALREIRGIALFYFRSLQ